MYWGVEPTKEEEDELIRKIAKKILEYGMATPFILLLEGYKPLAYVGGSMAIIFISNLLPMFGPDTARGGEKLFKIFMKPENVQKLIQLLEEDIKEKKQRKNKEKEISKRPSEQPN